MASGLTVAALAWWSASRASPAGFDELPEYAPDHVVIRLRSDHGTRSAGRSDVRSGRVPPIEGLPQGVRVTESAYAQWLGTVEQAKAGGGREEEGTAPTEFSARLLYASVPAGRTAAEMEALLRGHPAVEFAARDPIGTGGAVPQSAYYFTQQWGLWSNAPPGGIHAPEAWDISTGTSDVLVAVLDTGCNTSLVEFAGRTLPGTNFTADPDADGHGHGTAVASVLAANPGPESLVAGLDWHCRVMPVKVINDRNVGEYSHWVQGVDWAVAKGAKIINLSAGGMATNFPPLRDAITNAIARGVIFITIAHNDGGAIRFPGSMPEVITVGATDSNGVRCSFSNTGPALDLVAPGTNIVTVSTNGTGLRWLGTSMAAPHVAGAAALLCAVRPGLTHREAWAALCAGADDAVGDSMDTRGWDPFYGWGRLNVHAALLLTRTRVAAMRAESPAAVKIEWTAPSNASNRMPYVVEWAAAPTGDWQVLPWPTGLQYSPARTAWWDDGVQTAPLSEGGGRRVYRVGITPR